MIRVVFMGTPDFAVRSLTALASDDHFDIVGVVTQPDRPAGRGKQVASSAVKIASLKFGLPVLQPESLKDPAALNTLTNWRPEVIVVAAFGQILRQAVLALPPYSCVNVHASLLPRWRGAAPIQYAIRAGDEESGVTIMKMDKGLDTGPILAQSRVEIDQTETGTTLHDKLAELGARLLVKALLQYTGGEITPIEQSTEGVTVATSLHKTDGEIDWNLPSIQIDRVVRAFDPWPGTYTFIDGDIVKVLQGKALLGPDSTSVVGAILRLDNELIVQTGDGLYQIDIIQPAGKRRMTGHEFLAGHSSVIGLVCGNPSP